MRAMLLGEIRELVAKAKQAEEAMLLASLKENKAVAAKIKAVAKMKKARAAAAAKATAARAAWELVDKKQAGLNKLCNALEPTTWRQALGDDLP